MKTYRGVRTPDGCRVTVNGAPLNPCNKIRNHSPDGFEWGYGGSGPAQLALALLVNAIGDKEVAQMFYQRFKFAVISGISADEWEMTSADIRAWFVTLEEANAVHWAPDVQSDSDQCG